MFNFFNMLNTKSLFLLSKDSIGHEDVIIIDCNIVRLSKGSSEKWQKVTKYKTVSSKIAYTCLSWVTEFTNI